MKKELNLSAREIVGHVAVDSGQVLLVDPCYLGEWKNGEYIPDTKQDNHYAKACEITLSKEGAGSILVAGIAGHGVVSGTYDGDGSYPVFADRDSEERIRGLYIKFD